MDQSEIITPAYHGTSFDVHVSRVFEHPRGHSAKMFLPNAASIRGTETSFVAVDEFYQLLCDHTSGNGV